jgi:hypothetical protein
MANEWFDEGITPGSLKESDDIKILICYLLKSVARPLSFDNLNEILQHDGLCNYFGFASALNELQKSGHIELVKDGELECYKASDLGTGTAEMFERRLPLTIRERAVNAAVRLFARIKREAENRVEIEEENSGGFSVTCSVLDIGDTLMQVKLLVTDRAQAQAIQRQFQGSPEIIYKGVLALMTGDVKAAAELVKPQE